LLRNYLITQDDFSWLKVVKIQDISLASTQAPIFFTVQVMKIAENSNFKQHNFVINAVVAASFTPPSPPYQLK